jgi:prepilin-type N-terminal cleavage/methylation domain-containing protein
MVYTNNMKTSRSGFTQTLTLASLRGVFNKIYSVFRDMNKSFFSLFSTQRNKNTMQKLVSGFTLIELLVVIAIIALISSIIITSLVTSRDKGSNAAVKANLNILRVKAEAFFDDPTGGNGTYSGLCTSTVASALAFQASMNDAHVASEATGGIKTTSATQQNINTTNCHSQSGGYAVSAPLKAPETVGGVTFNYWCVDSVGFSAGRNLPLAGSSFTCPSS